MAADTEEIRAPEKLARIGSRRQQTTSSRPQGQYSGLECVRPSFISVSVMPSPGVRGDSWVNSGPPIHRFLATDQGIPAIRPDIALPPRSITRTNSASSSCTEERSAVKGLARQNILGGVGLVNDRATPSPIPVSNRQFRLWLSRILCCLSIPAQVCPPFFGLNLVLGTFDCR